MPDGQEEREELRQQEKEKKQNPEDRLYSDPLDDWQPERLDS